MKALRVYRAGAMLTLLGALGGASGLHAQSASPYSYLFKMRGGLTAGDIQKTHFDNKLIGFGAEIKREILSGGSAVTAEVTWEYVPGRHHDIYPWDTNPLNLPSRARSYENRKEYGQGINIRVAYSAPLTIPFVGLNFEWFAGLGIDRFKVRSEVEYTFNYINTNNPTRPDLGNYDGNSFVKESSQFSPGVFAGLKCKLTADFGLEVSCRNFGMWHYEFTPISYYDKSNFALYGTGISKTGTSRGWALELALAAKL